MTQVLFDSRSAVDDIKRGGFTEEQAKANVREALEGGVATKADVAKLDARMDTLEASVRGDMNTLRAEMRVMQFRILAALAGATGLLAALRLFA